MGFKKPGNVSVHLAETVGTTKKALGVTYVDLKVLGEEPQVKPPKPMNAFDLLTKAASMKILPLEVKTDDENHTQWEELHNHLLQIVGVMLPAAGFPTADHHMFFYIKQRM